MKLRFGVQTPNLVLSKKQSVEGLKDVLWECMVKMETLAKNNAPVNFGLLKARIHLSPESRGAEEYTLSDGVEYGVHVEYGTSPHWVPIEPLKLWARRKLKDESLAYAVRAKIAKEGTNEQPFFRPALDEVRTVWLPVFKKRVFG